MNTTTPGSLAFPISQAADDDVERLLSLPGTEVLPVRLTLDTAAALRQAQLHVADVQAQTYAEGRDGHDLARAAGFPDRVAYLRVTTEDAPALADALAGEAAEVLRWWGQPDDVWLAGEVSVGHPLLLELAPEPGDGDPVAWPDVPGHWERDEEDRDLVLGARRPHTLVLPRYSYGPMTWARMVADAIDGDPSSLASALQGEAAAANLLRDPVHTGNVVANRLSGADPALRPWWQAVVASLDAWHAAHDELLSRLEESLPVTDPVVADLRAAGRYSETQPGQGVRWAYSQHTIDTDQRRVWGRARMALWALQHGSDDVVTGVRAGLLPSMEDRITAERLAVEAPGWVLADDIVALVGKLDEGALLHPDDDDLTLIRLADTVDDGTLASSSPTWVTATDVRFKGAAVTGVTRTDRLARKVVFGPELLTAAITGSVEGRTKDTKEAIDQLAAAIERLQHAQQNLERAQKVHVAVAVERDTLADRAEQTLERARALEEQRDQARDELEEAGILDEVGPDGRPHPRMRELEDLRDHAALERERLVGLLESAELAAQRVDQAAQQEATANRTLAAARSERDAAAHAVAGMRERGGGTRDPKGDAARTRAMLGLTSLHRHLARTDHRWLDRVAEMVDSAAAVVPQSTQGVELGEVSA